MALQLMLYDNYLRFSLLIVTLLTIFIAIEADRPDYTGLRLEPYCKTLQCCTGRQDECSAEIYGTYYYFLFSQFAQLLNSKTKMCQIYFLLT